MENKEVITSRMEWYRVYNTGLRVIDTASRIGINSQNVVFIGGLACLFHIKSTFGMRAVPNWRGTEDIDLLVFGEGNAQRLMGGLKTSPLIEYYQSFTSHLPNKWSCRVNSKNVVGGCLPSGREAVDIDLYGQVSRQGINLNERFLKPDCIVYDPPENVKIDSKRETTIPSLRDITCLKFDILQYSDFRLKDVYDILGCFAVAEKRKASLRLMIRDIYRGVSSPVQYERTEAFLRNLKDLTAKPEVGWLVPSSDYLKNLTHYL